MTQKGLQRRCRLKKESSEIGATDKGSIEDCLDDVIDYCYRYKLLIHVFKLEPSGASCKKILESTTLTGWQIG